MKKTIMALCLIFSSFLLLTSCKKDGPSTKSVSILGKWTLTEQGRDQNGNGRLDAGETSDISRYILTLDLKADKSFEWIYKSDDNNYTSMGTYTYENNKLNLTYKDGIEGEGVEETQEAEILSLTKDNLTLGTNYGSLDVFKR